MYQEFINYLVFSKSYLISIAFGSKSVNNGPHLVTECFLSIPVLVSSVTGSRSRPTR